MVRKGFFSGEFYNRAKGDLWKVLDEYYTESVSSSHCDILVSTLWEGIGAVLWGQCTQSIDKGIKDEKL